MTTINHLKQTHTFTVLELPKHMADYIAQRMRDAGYDHAFNECDGKIVIDMNGLAIGAEDEPVVTAGSSPYSNKLMEPGTVLPPIVQSFELDPDRLVEATGKAITDEVQRVFDEHPKKQPTMEELMKFRPFSGTGIPVVTDEEGLRQLEEDKNWKPVEGMDIVDKKDE